MSGDDDDREQDGRAEALLRTTIADLQQIVRTVVAGKKLSTWGSGRVIHGGVQFDLLSESLINQIKDACRLSALSASQDAILYGINQLIVAAFKIGQGSDRPSDQKQHEESQRTQAAHEGRRKGSGKSDRLEVVCDVINGAKEQDLPTNILLMRANKALREKGLDEIEVKTFLRYKKDCESKAVDNDRPASIASAFLRSD